MKFTKGYWLLRDEMKAAYAVEYGSRLIMMHQGEAIMDKGGEEKKVLRIEEILDKFNEISVECGN